MPSVLAHPVQTASVGQVAPGRSAWRTLLLAGFLSAELFVFCALLGAYAVFRASHPEVQRGLLRFPQSMWGGAQLAVLVLACLTIWMVRRRLSAGRAQSGMILATIAVLYGLTVLGLRGVEWARFAGPQIIDVHALLPAPQTPAQAGPQQAAPKAASAADPELGAKAFAMTCAACHGASGQGLGSVAPAIKNTEYVTQSSDAEVTRLIVEGRSADDPASKTGKVMPARGGNPFLSDIDVAHIIAFLRDGGSSEGASSTTGIASAPRWVVPLPPPGPAGLSADYRPAAPPAVPDELLNQQPTAPERAFASIAAMLTGLHAIHLLIALALTGALIWQAYMNAEPDAPACPSDRPDLRLAGFTRLYWLAGLILWVVLFPVLYVI